MILSSNNLRSLPVEIKKMKSLEKLDLSKNGLRCNHGNDFSGLPHEMADLQVKHYTLFFTIKNLNNIKTEQLK